jgi:hypothetical protein
MVPTLGRASTAGLVRCGSSWQRNGKGQRGDPGSSPA